MWSPKNLSVPTSPSGGGGKRVGLDGSLPSRLIPHSQRGGATDTRSNVHEWHRGTQSLITCYTYMHDYVPKAGLIQLSTAYPNVPLNIHVNTTGSIPPVYGR